MSSTPALPTPDPLQTACDAASAALFVVDASGQCTYMNAAARALTGWSPETLEGRALLDALRCGHDEEAQLFVHRDGREYPVACTTNPLMRDGEVVGAVIEVRDVSREMRREVEDVAFRQLSERMLEEFDLTAMVQAVTDTATQLTHAQFGAFFYNVTDDGGDSYMLYALSGVPAEKFSNFPHPRATPLFGPTFNGEGTIRIDDVRADPRYGQWTPHHGMPPGHLPVRSYLAVPVKSDHGEVLGGLFFGHAEAARFTTDHVRTIESIAALAAIGMSRLRLFVAAQADAREKERLYQNAVRAGRMKDQFLATISHELRTPLTSILGWSEMLASGRLSPEMVERAVQTIDRNARAQAQIVEDLLDISRIVSGKLHLAVREIDAMQPVEAAVDAVRPAALARGVRLEVHRSDAGHMRADPDRLQQVIWNLVANAVKFTERGGVVDVSVTRVDDAVEIRVRDTGRGIDAEFLPRVFERFSQVDASSTREHGGLGLGLSIVRHLVEMHGGTVRAESAGSGHGAEFVVCLPVSAAGSASATERRHGAATVSPRPAGDDALHACRVLLVEDDADTRAMLASVLEAHGAEVDTCASARDALEAARRHHPDLVISDIGMPGMDGYDFVRALRDWEVESGLDAVPAVALTAYARLEDRTRALASGFQVHVAKPVQPSELVAVAQTLRRWRVPAASG
ncbi:response regulator [Lysobacter sp. TY2-98]|uniref:hybrid sensor histidine kinase/response regulator n=1 Tax=Lysobacter sp. TY2-98 TaxID=2290922 RepID=UPI000E1FBC7C|nr:ATP-binding protein [Lysobacter sp. TY2-98]AXK72984.1 response regulator [Lysobacter sp. TY2-98]